MVLSQYAFSLLSTIFAAVLKNLHLQRTTFVNQPTCFVVVLNFHNHICKFWLHFIQHLLDNLNLNFKRIACSQNFILKL